MELANQNWPLVMKLAITAMAIVIVISKSRSKIKIETNIEGLSKLYKKVQDENRSNTALMKEDLKQMLSILRLM
ncbi:9940_t:CDS:1, partial [Gigaspora margarita]